MKEYNMDDVIDFIVKNSNIDRGTVERVLELEEEWMESVEIATPIEEMDKDEFFLWTESIEQQVGGKCNQKK